LPITWRTQETKVLKKFEKQCIQLAKYKNIQAMQKQKNMEAAPTPQEPDNLDKNDPEPAQKEATDQSQQQAPPPTSTQLTPEQIEEAKLNA
jgi:hypothetical protein